MGRVDHSLNMGLCKACEALIRTQGANRSTWPGVRTNSARPTLLKDDPLFVEKRNARGWVEAKGDASRRPKRRFGPLPPGRDAIVGKVRRMAYFRVWSGGSMNLRKQQEK